MNGAKLIAVVGIAAALWLVLWLALHDGATESPSAAPEPARARASTPAPEVAPESAPAEPPYVEELPAGVAVVEPPPEPAPEPRPAPPPSDDGPATITLYGFLLPPEGHELAAETEVALTDRLGERRTTRAGPDGAYAFGDLAPGPYWLHAGGRAVGEARRSVELEAARSEQRLDLALELAPRVLVSVVDAQGAPFSTYGLLAVATLAPPGEWFDEVSGALNNPFGVGELHSGSMSSQPLGEEHLGELVLHEPPPLFVSLVHYHRVIATKRLAPGQDALRFVVDRESPLLQGSELRFHFVDAATGEALRPDLAILGGLGGRFLMPVDGEFRTPGLPPGWYELSAQVPGYAGPPRRILVEPIPVNDLGAVSLEAGVELRGRVVDETGAGVATRIDYAAFDLERGRPTRHFGGMGVRSDAQGRFAIPGLGRDVYFLQVGGGDAPWALAGRRVDLRAGRVEDVALEVARGTPLVLRLASPRARGLHLRVLDAAGELVHATRIESEIPRALPLAPGRYTVEARPGDAAPVRREVRIGSEPVELTLP